MNFEVQKSLFDVAPAPWEVDDQSEQFVATVVFARGPDRSFDYVAPDHLRDQLEPGRRVRAPLGKSGRLVTGYCVALESRTGGSRTLKELEAVVDRQSLLSPAMIRLTRWMAEHYLCPWGQVIEAVVPAGVKTEAGTREITFYSVPTEVAARLTLLKLPLKQANVLKHVAAGAGSIPAAVIMEAVGCTMAPIAALAKKGLLVGAARRVSVGEAPAPDQTAREEPLALNADQNAALSTILNSLTSATHDTVLIHGVTGSGKTEVYMQAIREVLRYGRQAIVLVPEISLTPQAEQRFRARFGQVAVLHSHLSDVERRRHWREIARGAANVILGARSAIFAPTRHLGIIILDEEHESSFKQGESPRYHARDVAIERARAEGIPLVLGSATPSLESWLRAHQGEYRLAEMPRRVFGRPLPKVETVDLRAEALNKNSRGAISRGLHRAMAEALKDGGQVILLLNRRGYSTHIQCPACGLVLRCPHCEIALTHHLHEEAATCHYCDYRQPAPTECPECRFSGVHYSGRGTQKLEMEVRARFPDYPCMRMDTDAMRKSGSHARALDAFHSGKTRILLGTQMIAKGLDFPNVTLVGVINADTALHLADFRAAERTFQLVTQVAGRTGRGDKGGRVIVQTFSPDHPAIMAAAEHNYQRFADAEAPERAQHGYPPFTSMARIVVRGPVAKSTREFAAYVAGRVREAVAAADARGRVLGPAEAPIARLRGRYRFHLQATSPDGALLREALRKATHDLKPPEEIQWIVDIDPLDML